MKKLTLIPVLLFLLVQTTFAGGILTNTNQSAQWLRTLSRNASTQIDAVYYNPAGLMKMENGLHLGIYNQSIFQTRTIVSGYPYLNTDKYEGDVVAPLFPTAYAVYKMDNLAFSFGFGPNGGGGSADYKNGLPSFIKKVENQVNGMLVPGLAGLSAFGMNVQEGYDVKINFEGTSVFWGLQLGLSAKVSDAFSVYGGVRYLPSINTYEGSIENIQLMVNGSFINAQEFLGNASGAVSAAAQSASDAASGLQPLITAGAGSYTLDQIQGAGYIDAAKRAELTGGLMALGLTEAQINAMNVGQIQGAFTTGSNTLNATAQSLDATKQLVGDQAVKTKQTGSGFTPIIGANISPNDQLNIGLKYEFKTKMTLENDTEVDDTGLFTDGDKTPSDIPAILTAGIEYKFSDKFDASVSYNTYFDKDVDWGKNILMQEKTIESNYWELALGLQFHLSEVFTLSTGFMRSHTGVTEQYNSDFSFSNSSYTGGIGIEWKASDKLTLDAGFMATNYESVDKDFGTYTENYDKATYGFAIGVSYSIFK